MFKKRPMRFIPIMLLLAGSQIAVAETISGFVTDDGTAVPHAYVSLYESGSSVVVETSYTDEKGRYRFSVSPGNYQLRVSVEEYPESWVKGIALEGTDLVINVALTPTAFTDDKSDSSEDDCN